MKEALNIRNVLFWAMSLSSLLFGMSAQRIVPPASFQRSGFAASIGWQPGDSILRIPAEVTEIPDFAFADCLSLRSLSFAPGSRCAAIGEYAFWNCRNLRTVSLPPSLRVIRMGAFRECASLDSLALPKGLGDIKGFAFIYCRSLRDVSFPASLTHIGLNAFASCTSLRAVVLPNKMREIESYAFADCDSLEYARLPANGNLLGELIFNCCPRLSLIEQPSAVPPPFDCNSYIFSPLDTEAYTRCVLKVPEGKEALYSRSAGWNLFF